MYSNIALNERSQRVTTTEVTGKMTFGVRQQPALLLLLLLIMMIGVVGLSTASHHRNNQHVKANIGMIPVS